MAERQLGNVPDILESDVFNTGMNVVLSMGGRFRDIASMLLRNAISKAIIHGETRDPADSDQVAGLTQYWINTTTKERFISINGEDWVNVTASGTAEGGSGWSPLLSIESDNDRRVLKVVDWTGGGGTKPAINQYLGATGFDTDISNGVDIRGIQGLRGIQGIAGDAGNNAWTPTLAIEADNARRVMKVVDWTGGGGTKPAINQYLTSSGFDADIANAVDIRGAAGEDGADGTGSSGGLTVVASDSTLQGDGTADSQLGLASEGVLTEHIRGLAVTFAKLAVDVPQEIGAKLITVSSNTPSASDLESSQSQVWYDTTKGEKWVSSSGAAWRLIEPATAINQPNSLGNWNVRQTDAAPNAGHVDITTTTSSNLIYISTTNVSGTSHATRLSALKVGDYLHIGDAVYKIVSITRQTASPDYYSITGTWIKTATLIGNDNVGVSVLSLGRTLADSSVEARHLAEHFAVRLREEYRVPTNNDRIPGVSQLWLNLMRDDLYISENGSAFLELGDTEPVGKADDIGYIFDVVSGATAATGQIAISPTDTNLINISVIDADGDDDVGDDWTRLLRFRDIIYFGNLAIVEIVSNPSIQTGTPAFNRMSVRWRFGNPSDVIGETDVSIYWIKSHKAIGSSAVRRYHLHSEITDLLDSTPDVETGKITALGEFQNRNSLTATAQFADAGYSSDAPQVDQLEISDNNSDGTNIRTELLSLVVGDIITIQGVNSLRLSAVPIGSSGQVNIKGTWLHTYDATDTSSGSNYDLFFIKQADYIHTSNARRPGTIVGVNDDNELEYTENPQGQGGEGGVVAINSGMFETLGSWTWTSSSAPATGHFYVEATALTIFETAGDGVNKGTVLDTVMAGDRIQVDDKNTFVIAAGVTPTNGIYRFTGYWVDQYNSAHYDGSMTLRRMKKNDIIVRNVVKPRAVLEIDDTYQIDAKPPGEIDVLWSGDVSGTTTSNQLLNAGRKFSDYRHLYFRVRGNNRPHWNAIPGAEFAQQGFFEVQSRGNSIALEHESDTSFSVFNSQGTDIILNEIVGV